MVIIYRRIFGPGYLCRGQSLRPPVLRRGSETVTADRSVLGLDRSPCSKFQPRGTIRLIVGSLPVLAILASEAREWPFLPGGNLSL